MPRLRQFLTRTIVASVAVLLAVACEDAVVPTAPTEDIAPLPHVITCRAAVAAGTVSCQGLHSDPVPGLSLSVVVGGQGTYVQLASTGVSYDGSDVFQADVTVQNLIAQPMGTPDGTTVTGIKVFFHSGPTVTSGTGTVSVANEDGTATFTASDQPYFEYNTILQKDEVSAAKTWQWSVPSSVTTFEFSVYVSTDIPVAPGEWEATPTPAFGTADFTVNDQSSAITNLRFNFNNYTCGSVTKNGSVGFGSTWSITDRQFSIDHSAMGDRFVFAGTFSTLGDEASGTWELTLSGNVCSGTWEAAPKPIPLQLFGPGLVAQNSSFTVDLRLDMTESSAVAGAVAVEIGWDPSAVELDGALQGAFSGWYVTWASGLRIVVSSTSGLPSETTLVTIPYRAIGAGGTTSALSLDVYQVIASSTFDDISSALEARGASVTIN